jgi:hypothetical protein
LTVHEPVAEASLPIGVHGSTVTTHPVSTVAANASEPQIDRRIIPMTSLPTGS